VNKTEKHNNEGGLYIQAGKIS